MIVIAVTLFGSCPEEALANGRQKEVGLASLSNPVELVNKRTETSKTYSLGSDKYRLVSSIEAIHYKDNYNNPAEQWKDIDLTVANNQITKAPYVLSINQTAKQITIQDKKTGDFIILQVTQVPDGKLDNFVLPFTPQYTGVKLDLPHDSVISILKSKLSTSIKITEKADGTTTYVDIDDKTKASITKQVNSEINVRTSASTDDCCWSTELSAILLTDDYLLFGERGGYGFYYDVGCRFQNINIDSGATVDVAYVQFKGYAADTDDTIHVDIYGEQGNNVATFSTVANADGRTLTTAKVDWDFTTDWAVNGTYNTPSLVSIIQELVNDYDGLTAANIAVIFKDSGSTLNAERQADSYDYDSAKAPLLHVEFSGGVTVPSVTTVAADDIESTTATLNGEVTDDNGETIQYYGFVWGESDEGDPGDVDPSNPAGSWDYGWKSGSGDYGENPFDHGVTGLPDDTTIYFRAAAYGDVSGWVYGDALNFNTEAMAAPDVTTSAATDILTTSATGNGNITDLNYGGNATVRGFEWDTDSGAPYAHNVYESGSFGTGAYSLSMTSLPAGSTIYYRAYATNPEGTGYGSEQNFNTLATVPPSVTTVRCTGFTSGAAIVNGIMTDEGDTSVTQWGFDYGLTTGYGSSVTETEALEDGDEFWYNLTSLSPATVYHYRAKAYSSEGWGYGEDMIFSTKGSPARYEHLSTGQDGDSAKIYGVNWAYMQFTADDISHTATSLNLYLKRLGEPGTVTLSLRHGAGEEPTGNDFVSTTFDGDSLSTGYQMYNFVVSEESLQAGQQYAVVARAIAGDTDNCIYWGVDNGGSLSDAVYGTSTDGGLSFSSDSPKDALFEIWGNPCIEVVSAKVFTGYKESGDMLFIADVGNIYAPYYPDSDARLYFQLQIMDDAIIEGSTDFKAWERQPLAVYFNANKAAALTWGGEDIKIRIQALFDADVYSEYNLLSSDWSAGDLLYLDGYVRTLASTYERYYREDYLTDIAGQSERVLNEAGSIMFIRGIPGLEIVRPDLFYTSFGISKPSITSHTLLAPNASAALGTDVYARLQGVADLFGDPVDVDTIIGWILAAIALIIGFACVGVGHGIAGILIGLFPAGGAGFLIGGIPVMVLGAIGFVFLLLIVLWIAKLVIPVS